LFSPIIQTDVTYFVSLDIDIAMVDLSNRFLYQTFPFHMHKAASVLLTVFTCSCTSIFLAALVLLSNAANIANILNLVSYLREEMHMDVARASTMASNFFAALQMFSIPAAFLADSYVKRFYTVLIFGPITILVLYKLLLHFFRQGASIFLIVPSKVLLVSGKKR
jgi:hypothetical protein